jgi:hypothetical protein
MMSYKKIIVDDDYIEEMAYYYNDTGILLQNMIDAYINIMNLILNFAIKSGEVHEAIRAFVTCAEQMKGCINETAQLAKRAADEFLVQIDEKDNFLF